MGQIMSLTVLISPFGLALIFDLKIYQF